MARSHDFPRVRGRPRGAWLKNDSKVAEDGTLALAYAYIRILSGHFRNALVVSECLYGVCNFHSVTNIIFDPYYWRRLGLDATSLAALQASCYMSKYRDVKEKIREAAAKIAVNNIGNAKNTPYADRKMDLTVDDVLNPKILAHPTRELDHAPL